MEYLIRIECSHYKEYVEFDIHTQKFVGWSADPAAVLDKLRSLIEENLDGIPNKN